MSLFGGVSGFNPRAREGRDITSLDISRSLPVSIHAPVKGATKKSLRVRWCCDVSIHAPVKGATAAIFTLAAFCRFNPRAREGRDPRR